MSPFNSHLALPHSLLLYGRLVHRYSGSGTFSKDFAGDRFSLTRGDVEAALTLLSLSGKEVGMDYVYAGLAVLDLRRATVMTLENYLLTMEQR